jgi:hypothetical protein
LPIDLALNHVDGHSIEYADNSSAAKYLPGQDKTRDHMHPGGPHHEHGRADLSDQAAALKPSGEQTMTEKVKTQADK